MRLMLVKCTGVKTNKYIHSGKLSYIALDFLETHVPEMKWRLHRRECSVGCQSFLFMAAIHLFLRSGSTGNLYNLSGCVLV